LSTFEGQAFAATAGVTETTLLFFDRNGNSVKQHQGVTTEGDLRKIIDSTFQLRRAQPADGNEQRANERQRN
jgi:hypothetical protein